MVRGAVLNVGTLAKHESYGDLIAPLVAGPCQDTSRLSFLGSPVPIKRTFQGMSI